eukprot:TRINITY_DN1956_c0_g2_i1.p1 TRINITY_DN1956_c0_g2~~TRINITY_DN1956_c0_g2_i1.p1  ORF type:complete len:1216 (+),score=337.50 TRINITY_DN1956_c0_g2_i1:375-4022(+)
MASSKKPRVGTKRMIKATEGVADKEDGATNKNRQRKRKLSDFLGPQWTKSELETFYEAYRKYGRDWKKVASVIRNRTAEMVEALFGLNKAYLSLPDGQASTAGLIAMMTDHYSLLEGSDSDEGSGDGFPVSRCPQKHSGIKKKHSTVSKSERLYSDLLQYKSRPPNSGCPSPVKRKRSTGRIVGKRTPRFPVTFSLEKPSSVILQSVKQGSISDDANDDIEVAKAVALTLAEASQRAASPQVSQTPSRKSLQMRSSSAQNGDRKISHAWNDSGGSAPKPPSGSIDEGSLEGSQEIGNGSITKTDEHGTVGEDKIEISNDSKVKTRKSMIKKTPPCAFEPETFDNVKEECSSTEEGIELRKGGKESVFIDADDGKRRRKVATQRPRKRGRQLFSGDESSGLDTLAHLADLSLHGLLPSPTVESESSALAKEDKNGTGRSNRIRKHSKDVEMNEEKNRTISSHEKVHQKTSDNSDEVGMREKQQEDSRMDGACDSSPSDVKKKRRKVSALKVQQHETPGDSCSGENQKIEDLAVEGPKFRYKSKKYGNAINKAKLGKPFAGSATEIDRTCSVGTLLQTDSQTPTDHASLPTKPQSRRKMAKQRAFISKASNPREFSDVCGDSTANEDNKRPTNVAAFCPHVDMEDASSVKVKLIHCLSSSKLRSWCIYEWFYSAIDWPWFARNEFVDYLEHTGLGHVPRLTRVEWGVIRRSLGKPRRLSQKFLQEERKKLEEYRESVRQHYNEVRAGIRDGLPTDLARPLSVGQRVIACHPKTREVHDGSILTVDRNRCRVQFDRQDLGVEFVLDIDCMPLNCLENMPEAFRRKNTAIDASKQNIADSQHEPNTRGRPVGGLPKISAGTEKSFGHPSKYFLNALLKQAKVDSVDSVVQAKAAANEAAAAAQQAMYNPPCTLAQIQAREADIRALADLTRALDKKEAILVELKNMNDEVDCHKKNGEAMRNSEGFQRQYATVLHQLRDANDQVALALVYLRQRNTYKENSLPPWQQGGHPQKGVAGSKAADPSCFVGDMNSQIMEIVLNSKMKAKMMVDEAIQELKNLKNGDSAIPKIGGFLDSMKFSHVGADANRGKVGSQLDHSKDTGKFDNSFASSEANLNGDDDGEQKDFDDKKEAHVPSELITSCIAALLMIQSCTERQYPPADVAQILENALTSLQPHSNNNLAIYREIQQWMGVIKHQILALIPTHPSLTVSAELPTVPRK